MSARHTAPSTTADLFASVVADLSAARWSDAERRAGIEVDLDELDALLTDVEARVTDLRGLIHEQTHPS